MTYKIRETQ